MTDSIELSIVMPCLNEADTLAICINKAKKAIAEHEIHAEIIIADNGSDDGSIQIAEELGARVVHVERKGYGSALIGGITAAEGKYVLMADADDSYDFLEVPKFLFKIREGYEMVQGCRLPWGGGTVLPGAMPFLHRWWGNPMFSIMVRQMFGAPIHDVYCGMRIFTKAMYERLDMKATGMEFATEMIIKASLQKESIAEIPITLHPDGRKAHAPHLKTFRDGWRTLTFFMLNSPKWLFFIPGLLFAILGTLGYALALPQVVIAGAAFDVHTLLVASLCYLIAFQCFAFAIFGKIYGINSGFLPEDPFIRKIQSMVTFGKGLSMSLIPCLLGLGMVAWITIRWAMNDFGPLDYPATLRWVIPGVTLMALGVQSMFFSSYLAIISIDRK